MTCLRQCYFKAFLLLPAVLMVSQAKADLKRCLLDQFNTALPSPTSHTWDQRYPGNPIAQALDRMILNEVSRDVGNKKVLNAVADSFQSRGITFKRVTTPDGIESLVILPVGPTAIPKGSPLNRLAYGILKYNPDFELRYTPDEISEFYTQGIRGLRGTDPQTGHPYIEIGHAAAIEGTANEPTLVHEVIHAKHVGDEERGRVHAYSIRATTNGSPKGLRKRHRIFPAGDIDGAYDTYLKFDELITFRHNLWASARAFTESMRKGTDSSLSKVQLDIAIGRVLEISRKARAMADITDDLLKTLEMSKTLKWGESVKFESSESKFKGFVELRYDRKGNLGAALKVEELLGILSKRRTISSYTLSIPLERNYPMRSEVPTKLIREYMESIRRTAETSFESANEAHIILEEMQKTETLSPLQKDNLLQQLENATRREKFPGYSTK